MKPLLNFLTKLIPVFSLVGLYCLTAKAATSEQLKIPDGFSISVFAQGVTNARQLAESDSGIIYAGSRRAGNVYALIDSDGDWQSDRQLIIAEGLTMPSGIALYRGDLYIAAVSTIYRIKQVDKAVAKLQQNKTKPTLEVFDDSWPSNEHHGWKYLKVTDDGRLIIPVGAPCNACEVKLPYAAIWAQDIKTKKKQLLAQGVRNTVGFDFQPKTGHLWFTDNGRDMMGDDIPADELNGIAKRQLNPKKSDPIPHYGFPYFHAQGIKDPDFPTNKSAENYQTSRHNIPAHFAPLGMTFYTGKQFPERYHNSVIIAEHGSWNRTIPGGYRVSQVILGQKQWPLDYRPLVEGFLQLKGTVKDFEAVIHGRPSDVLVSRDGSILIADDYAHAIYRLYYHGNKK